MSEKYKTLLDKAKEEDYSVATNKIKKEMLELAVSWAKGQVKFKAVLKAIGTTSPSSGYSFLAHALKEYVLTTPSPKER